MERLIKLANGSIVALVLFVAGCGGGGGSSSSGGPAAVTPPPGATRTPTPVATPTQLRAASSRNENTNFSSAGSITLQVDEIVLNGAEMTSFKVTVLDASGRAAAGQPVVVRDGLGLAVVSPPNGEGQTGADGTLSGTILAVAGGSYTLVATAEGAPFNGLSVPLAIVVNAPPIRTATPTMMISVTAGPSATATSVPCSDVETIIVLADPLNVSSQTGGLITVQAVVFDTDNRPVPRVNVLFDVSPRIATFSELVVATGPDGKATTHMTMPPNSPFGTLMITASACQTTGTNAVNVVSGVSSKPVSSIVLEADPPSVGSEIGGTINLKASVFDGDNQPINGIDVLFITSVGRVNPLVDRTRVVGSQGGVATSLIEVPIGVVATDQAYQVSALAGGVTGTSSFFVIPGRVPPGGKIPGVPPGMPASITLGASPTRLQVAGTGGTELSSVLGRVFDNGGNSLAGVHVRYHVLSSQSATGAVILPPPVAIPTGSPTPVPTTQCAPDDPFVISDVAGFAIVQLRSGSGPGTVTVVACADTMIDGVPHPLIEQQAVVSVTSGPVSRIGLSINSVFIDNNDGTLLTTASAIVSDAQGNVVEDGTPVSFEILLRKICSGGTRDGERCVINSECDGGTCVEDPLDPSRNVLISSNSTTFGIPPCDVTPFVPQTGIPVTSQPGDAITCIKFPVLQQATEILVRARAAGVVSNIAGTTLTLPGQIENLEARVSPQTIQVSDSSDGIAVVRATVLTEDFAPLENVRVRFTSSEGVIERSDLTNADGDAQSTLVIPAGTPSGEASIRVGAGGVQITNLKVQIVNTGGGSMTPTPGNSSAGAIQFVSAMPASIGVRGSGLPEQSILKFRVSDSQGMPAAGVVTNFSISKITSESIAPAQAVTDANGEVQTTLTSGERAMSIQVTAAVNSVNPPLLTRSTAVSVLGGPPSQPNFSLAHEFANISGRVTFGLENSVTAFVADRFGNPVPPGTAVTFTTLGGAIGNQLATNSLGQASGTLVSQAPVPSNGIVSTLATTQGERPFLDTNGSGVCDEGDTLLQIPEPFYDENCNGVHDTGEQFTDLNDNGMWDADQGSGVQACNIPVAISESICSTFSAATNVLLIGSGSGPIDAGGSRNYTLIISDNPDPLGMPGIGNPIVGGSTVQLSVVGNRGRILGPSNFTIPDALTNDLIIDGINRFAFTVSDGAPESMMSTDAVVVNVTSGVGSLPAGGNGSVTVQDFVTFLGAPTPTFTVTPTFTETPTFTPTPTFTFTNTFTPTFTPTATPQLPSIAPSQVNLSAGLGAPPTACNGATQVFTITGGAPPFAISATGGCVSTSSVAASGGTVTYAAGNAIGNFTLTVTDARSQTTNAPIAVQASSAAFIKVDLFVNSRGDNGDGTFTSVVGALVTDAQGVVVGDGVPVEFTLVSPVAGVSVTSPGFTNRAQQCTVNFSVVPQPGDALSCIKYAQSLQGSTITVRARVLTANGTFLDDTETIVLPDMRPTPTPTTTSIQSTPTITPTLPPGIFTFTPTATGMAPAGSIQFVGALPAAIGVRGSGLPEQSILTFLVTSTLGVPISGAGVQFALTGTGSESLNPSVGITDAAGMVSTAVTSGIQASTVRVVASVISNPSISGQSTAVGILGAPPAFNHFSVAPEHQNIAGRVTFGLQNAISAFVNDRFGNAVPPATSVSFITNAASVVDPTATDTSGVATATLLSEGLVPPTGIVTVMAYTRGEESFLDNNGNGVFDTGTDTILTDMVPEPFIDFRPFPPADAACTVPAPSNLCDNAFTPNTQYERFIDLDNNGMWDPQGTPGVWDDDIFVFDTVPVTFSGPLAGAFLDSCSGPPCNPFTIPNAGTLVFTINVHDDLLNPIVGGSQITITSTNGTVSGGSLAVPDGQSFNQLVPGLTQFSFALSDADPDPMSVPVPATITVSVTSQNGNGTFIIAGGTIQ